MVTDDVDVKGPRASTRFQERKRENILKTDSRIWSAGFERCLSFSALRPNTPAVHDDGRMRSYRRRARERRRRFHTGDELSRVGGARGVIRKDTAGAVSRTLAEPRGSGPDLELDGKRADGAGSRRVRGRDSTVTGTCRKSLTSGWKREKDAEKPTQLIIWKSGIPRWDIWGGYNLINMYSD